MAHGMTGTDYSDCKRRGPQQSSEPEALVNAAKFTAAQNPNTGPLRINSVTL